MKITVRNVYFTTKEVVNEIKKAESENYNLHIFINSVNTIRAIVKQLNGINYRTICSKESENKDFKLGGILKVSSINSPIQKINFYTATAFEGVDIYDPIGRTIIVSDTHIAQTLIDISTLMIQICGRLRDSEYKDEVLFICNTSNHRYMKYKEESEFLIDSDKIEQSAKIFEKDMNQNSEMTQKTQYDLYCENPESYHVRYLGNKNEKVIYDPNLKKIDIQNFNVISKIFNNTISVIKNVQKQEQLNVEIENKELLKQIYSKLPKLQITYEELTSILLPLYMNNKGMVNVIINSVSQYYTKSVVRLNGQRITVYDFTLLKGIACYL